MLVVLVLVFNIYKLGDVVISKVEIKSQGQRRTTHFIYFP